MARMHITGSRPSLRKKNEKILAPASHDGGPASIYHPSGSIDMLQPPHAAHPVPHSASFPLAGGGRSCRPPRKVTLTVNSFRDGIVPLVFSWICPVFCLSLRQQRCLNYS